MSARQEKLVRMIEQIARNHGAADLDTEASSQTIAATLSHVERFWDPRMQRLFLEQAQSNSPPLSIVSRQLAEQLAKQSG